MPISSNLRTDRDRDAGGARRLYPVLAGGGDGAGNWEPSINRVAGSHPAPSLTIMPAARPGGSSLSNMALQYGGDRCQQVRREGSLRESGGQCA
jgi:hypothetical protein